MKHKHTKGKKHYLEAGILGGLTAIVCCVAPVVLIILGVGAATAMAFMHEFHTPAVVAGIILVLLVSLYAIKQKAGVCNMKTIGQHWQQIVFAFAIMLVAAYGLNFFVVEPIADAVYGNLEIEQKPLGNLVEMAESHGMPEMADIEVVPEGKGIKQVTLEIDGLYCGSCGPAIMFDLKSISGVQNVDRVGNKAVITYDSDVTSKDILVATVHTPYTASIIGEVCIDTHGSESSC
ncbi:MAG: heavy-metal-associated domain-containing protein [Candidatus Woesearchaeota archaeon]|jgi:copper chaperone CopZ|nr:heavy-metal-associated domain-containing protein [Candidatus Woesearchaeota archaeon]MDP7181530.1 heavy-metal-associated domain-containing protein [Candidatus Woesearchaeota archaeon]MDP7198572.1 heavy-metal-associated domain-containing protein [Candidatus Woesearchaeota archaeon]MDP7466686.1 heavy-metal-associated domain-containing protein [Candidatus Woesearchaeota archaeon]MDP7647211.1 heavy-metal-associated domain-containing protein [Candidatus Woesearchaeota archaeon]